MANFLVDHEYTLDITPSARPQLVPVSEYDVGRIFTFTLKHNDEEMTIPSSYGAVTVEGTIGSYAFSEPASIENGKIVFQLTESMTAHAGKAWTKIKFANADAPISTCAFILAVDRAGVEADTVIGALGFEEQIVNAVNGWLDEHPPASGGMTEEFKQALLDCFENVAWINDDGQTYYDALYAALYPPVDVLSISAVFTQGSAVIYDTDSLDTLKQYLVVTATMADSTTQTVTTYTLSGTLAVGTSTITVSYGGKTDTFNVTVTEWQGLPPDYQQVEYIEGTGTQYIDTEIIPTNTFGYKIQYSRRNVQTDAAINGSKIDSSHTCRVGFASGKPYASWDVLSTDNGLSQTITAGDPATLYINYLNDRDIKQGSVSILKSTLSPLATLTGDYSNNPYMLFGQINAGTREIRDGLIFGIEFTSGTDVVANMIPCYNKTSGVIGMYDIVRKRFFTNDGTGTFSKGADVT